MTSASRGEPVLLSQDVVLDIALFLPAAKPAGQWIIIGVLLPAIFSELGFLVGFLKVRFLSLVS